MTDEEVIKMYDDNYMTFKTIAGITITVLFFIYLINLLIYENYWKKLR